MSPRVPKKNKLLFYKARSLTISAPRQRSTGYRAPNAECRLVNQLALARYRKLELGERNSFYLSLPSSRALPYLPRRLRDRDCFFLRFKAELPPIRHTFTTFAKMPSARKSYSHLGGAGTSEVVKLLASEFDNASKKGCGRYADQKKC